MSVSANYNSAVVTASGTVKLGHGDPGSVSTIVLQGLDASWDGTVIIKAAIRGTTNYVPIPYKRRNLVATASDDTIVAATITDTAFLIAIDASGLDVVAVCTRTAGTLTLNWVVVAG